MAGLLLSPAGLGGSKRLVDLLHLPPRPSILRTAFQAAPRPRKGIIPPELWVVPNINLTSACHSGRRANEGGMMSRELPEKPNLEHLKNQAKALLRSYQEGDAAAKERFASLSTVSAAAGPKLADALHLVAREYGFATWPKLKDHVQSLTRDWSPGELLCRAIRASDAGRVARVLEQHPELRAELDAPLADYGGGNTPLLAAVQHGDRKTIDVLLDAGADIHVRGHWWAG